MMEFKVECPHCDKSLDCEEDTAEVVHGEVLRSIIECDCGEPLVTEVKVSYAIRVRALVQAPDEQVWLSELTGERQVITRKPGRRG